MIGALRGRAAVAPLAVALVASGCNAIVGIDEPRLDRCIDQPGGGCQSTSSSSTGGAGGAAGSTTQMSSSSTGPAPARCGDGVLDPGEQCDDGNTVDGDGCSAHCMVECMGPGLYLDPTTFHCYRLVMVTVPWSVARDACVGAHEHLVTFTSAAELDAVAPHTPGQLWIDGERSGPGFLWDDGEPWTFDRWKGGTPPTDPSKSCVKLDGGNFNADDCMTKLPYLCERDPAGT